VPTYADQPVVQPTLKETPHTILPATIVLFVIGGVLFLAALIFFLETSSASRKAQRLTTETEALNAEISQLLPLAEKSEAYERVATDLRSLFNQQISWDQVLTKLEKRMYRPATLKSLQVNQDQTITVAGTVPTYTDYAKLMATLGADQEAGMYRKVRPLQITNTTTPDVAGAPAVKTTGVNFTIAISLTQQFISEAEAVVL